MEFGTALAFCSKTTYCVCYCDFLHPHKTKIAISSSVIQIAISDETSRKRPPKPYINGVRLREVLLYLQKGSSHCEINSSV